MKNIFLARERHLQVELREFQLAVRALVFVTKTFHDLKVLIQPGNHQYLLENLRRLRQRVKLPVMDAAGHQKIARALRRRARKHRRFHFKKAQLVHHLANFKNDAMAQRQVAVRPRPAQVQIAEAQPRLFRGIDFIFNRKRRRLGIVQDVQLRRHHLDFAAGEFRIGFLPLDDLAFHGHDEFAARLLGFGMRRRLRLFVENHLHDPGAVANIKKKQIAQVTPLRHPSHHQRVAPVIRRAQFAAVVCAFQIAQKIQHKVFPLGICSGRSLDRFVLPNFLALSRQKPADCQAPQTLPAKPFGVRQPGCRFSYVHDFTRGKSLLDFSLATSSLPQKIQQL